MKLNRKLIWELCHGRENKNTTELQKYNFAPGFEALQSTLKSTELICLSMVLNKKHIWELYPTLEIKNTTECHRTAKQQLYFWVRSLKAEFKIDRC